MISYHYKSRCQNRTEGIRESLKCLSMIKKKEAILKAILKTIFSLYVGLIHVREERY